MNDIPKTRKSPASLKPKKPRKSKKTKDEITSTSVAFRTVNIDSLKEHELVTKRRQSVSWIVNRLVEKLLEGEVAL